jgi:hypothetical protein
MRRSVCVGQVWAPALRVANANSNAAQETQPVHRRNETKIRDIELFPSLVAWPPEAGTQLPYWQAIETKRSRAAPNAAASGQMCRRFDSDGRHGP